MLRSEASRSTIGLRDALLRKTWFFVGLEDGFDGLVEQVSDAEGEGQTGVVASGLEGVDRLPGDVELVGEGSLAPLVELAERLQLVFHRLGARWLATSQPSMPAL